MYRALFGFARPPFEPEADAERLFRYPTLDEVNARLLYLLECCGIGMLTGEPGTGKTTAMRRLHHGLHPDQVRPIYLHDTGGNAAELYRQIACELGIEPEWSRAMTFRAIQQEVSRLARERHLTVLLVLDEAHRLRPDVLAELPSLCNFEWDARGRLCLLLVGHTGLRARLKLAALEALNQRIILRYALRGYDRDTTRAYVEHRLRVAGVDRPLFTDPALEALFGASGGIMRRIDVLAHHALLAAAAARARLVDTEHVARAAEEVRS